MTSGSFASISIEKSAMLQASSVEITFLDDQWLQCVHLRLIELLSTWRFRQVTEVVYCILLLRKILAVALIWTVSAKASARW